MRVLSLLLLLLLTSAIETDDCLISFIECSGEKFVVKQIKDRSLDEQFLLVLDALGCYIAETADIPVNKVTIIPAHVPFTGKTVLECPATLHTFANGSPAHDIDIHQRFRKENSPMWRRWGPLAPEQTGLTRTIIHEMGKHPDLPKIAALDTFVGNADRSAPNLFYDPLADRFCGIDMAASFCSPLALAACQRLQEIEFTEEELTALAPYAHTLEFLINHWPANKQENFLIEFSELAGFNVEQIDRIEFHKRCIKDNYKNCQLLLDILIHSGYTPESFL